MVPEELFSLALGLVPPWLVEHVSFTAEEKRLDLHIHFRKVRCNGCPSIAGEGAAGENAADHILLRGIRSDHNRVIDGE